MANRLAHALRALGVGRGDRVATLAENRVEYPAIYFALAKLGAIHVPVNFRYRASVGAASTGTCSSGETRASPATRSPAAIAGSSRARAPQPPSAPGRVGPHPRTPGRDRAAARLPWRCRDRVGMASAISRARLVAALKEKLARKRGAQAGNE